MRPNDELLQKIGQLRSKWKAFVWLRGLVWVLGAIVASVALGLYLAASPSVPFATVRMLSLFFLAGVAAIAVWKLFLPLRRLPTDMQLAQFVEEKNPGLEQSLISAVEAIEKPKTEHGPFSFLLIKDALERTRNVRFGEQINKKKFNAFAALNGGLVVAFLIGLYLVSFFMPAVMEKFSAAILHPPSPDEIKLIVTPGSTTVPKGSDVTIKAVLTGYDATHATIHFLYANSKDWTEASMDVVPDNQPTYQSRLFNLQEQVKYWVDASGKRSDEFTIQVADLPRVEKLQYTYNYPAYTGMPPMRSEGCSCYR